MIMQSMFGLSRRLVAPVVLVAALGLAGGAAAADLKPYQKDALDKIMEEIDPSARDMVRPQMEKTLSTLSEDQVRMMLQAMQGRDADNESADTASADQDDTDDASDDEDATASPEDLAYNRAQYEPVIRQLWQAQKDFDDFVDAAMATDCPANGTYAVFGSGWRNEVSPLGPEWNRASPDIERDLQIIGGSYAPQDGRYKFDFSKVRMSFDKAKVAAAIKSDCDAYRTIGEAFMAKAKPLAAEEKLDAIQTLVNEAGQKREPIAEDLQAALRAQSPSQDGALYTALLNGQKIK